MCEHDYRGRGMEPLSTCIKCGDQIIPSYMRPENIDQTKREIALQFRNAAARRPYKD